MSASVYKSPKNLKGCYVVLLLDPDECDFSPWSVRATSRSQAIRLAINLWHAWASEPGEPRLPDPDVLRVYERSWIEEIVFCSIRSHANHYRCPPTCGDPE